MSFGDKLRELRRRKKWSQDELGSKVGIHGRHIGKYENGQVMPNAETLIKIAKVFDVSVDYLLFDSPSQTPQEIYDNELLEYLAEVSKMDEQDKLVIKSLIEAYVKKKKIEAIMRR